MKAGKVPDQGRPPGCQRVVMRRQLPTASLRRISRWKISQRRKLRVSGVAARADAYEACNDEAGIKPLIEKALGVQTFREDREHDTEFMTISHWQSIEAMARFTGSDPRRIHHLDRDQDDLIELASSSRSSNCARVMAKRVRTIRISGVREPASVTADYRQNFACDVAGAMR